MRKGPLGAGLWEGRPISEPANVQRAATEKRGHVWGLLGKAGPEEMSRSHKEVGWHLIRNLLVNGPALGLLLGLLRASLLKRSRDLNASVRDKTGTPRGSRVDPGAHQPQ